MRRNALVLTACKQLTANSDTLNYFLNQFNFYSSINDKAELIIKSFYPYHNNKAQLVLTSLRLLERTHVTKSQFDFGIKNYFQKQAPTERDKLKRLIYLTCISEKWQQL